MFLKLFKTNRGNVERYIVNVHEVRAFEYVLPRNVLTEAPGSVTLHWRGGETTSFILGHHDENGTLEKVLQPADFEKAFAAALRTPGIHTLKDF